MVSALKESGALETPVGNKPDDDVVDAEVKLSSRRGANSPAISALLFSFAPASCSNRCKDAHAPPEGRLSVA